MAGVFSFPAILPELAREWDLTNTKAGWINGIYFAGYTLAVPFLASLTDRVDARGIYVTFAAVASLASIGFATIAQGFWTALVFRALGGLGLDGSLERAIRGGGSRDRAPYEVIVALTDLNRSRSPINGAL